MQKNRISIYVGCSLTHAPKKFKDDVELFKSNLRSLYEVHDFLGLVKGSEQQVYEHDIANVEECALFMAICDYPSLGLGYELATAIEKLQKPTLAVAHVDATITRMILGIRHPNYTFQRYRSFSDLTDIVQAQVANLVQP